MARPASSRRRTVPKPASLGSINETKSAFATNYEILWEDPSTEGVAWVEEEFEALWKDSYPLPDAIIEEIKRVADRVEIRFDEVNTAELPGAALAESPIYRGGEQLQPWQRAFVTMFLKHREAYGKARLLLADEVGVGKTLSLAASAMLSALLDDGPVLILCPSTITLQWQVELNDRLGIQTAVWSSGQKVWMDAHGHTIKTRGAEDITRCPFRIAIVSTGLIFHTSDERRYLLERKFGTVLLDEAHKARRRGGLGEHRDESNMTVLNDTRDIYRYVDCTFLAEMLFSFVEETIERELPAGILFLQQYDKARRLMRDVVDLPNRPADLFVRLCLQNNGKLSKSKPQLLDYAALRDEEIAGLEAAVAEAFALKTKN